MSSIERGPARASQSERIERADPADLGDSGWTLFAASMLLLVGFWNVFEGFFAFFNASWFVGTAAFGPLWFWSLLWIGAAIGAVAAGFGVIDRQAWGRWLGVVIVSVNAVTHLMALPVYPWWSVFALVIDVLILFGLTARWPTAERRVSE